jgi:hypothetical protein
MNTGGADAPIMDEDYSQSTKTVKAIASDGPEHPISSHVARRGSKVYVDLCDTEYRVVEIGPDGRMVSDAAPVGFVRSPHADALPGPEPGGTVDDPRSKPPTAVFASSPSGVKRAGDACPSGDNAARGMVASDDIPAAGTARAAGRPWRRARSGARRHRPRSAEPAALLLSSSAEGGTA